MEVGEDDVNIQYYKGTYDGVWDPDYYQPTETGIKRKREKKVPWEQTLPKSCILLCDFKLTKQKKLYADTKTYLRREYSRLKELNEKLESCDAGTEFD